MVHKKVILKLKQNNDYLGLSQKYLLLGATNLLEF